MENLRRKCTKKLVLAVAERLLFMVCVVSFGIYIGTKIISPYVHLVILLALIMFVTYLVMATKDRIETAIGVDTSDDAASVDGAAYHGLDSGPLPFLTDTDFDSNYSEDAPTIYSNQDDDTKGKSPTSEPCVPGKPQHIAVNIIPCSDESLPSYQDEETDFSSGRCSLDTEKFFASGEMSLPSESDEVNSTEWPLAKFYIGDTDESDTGNFDFNKGGIYFGSSHL